MSTDHRIIEKFLTDYPDIILAKIENWEIEEIAELVEALPHSQSAKILSQIQPYRAGSTIGLVSSDVAIKVIELLPVKIATTLLLQVAKSVQSEILKGLKPDLAKHLTRSLQYAKGIVGAHVEPAVATLNKDEKIGVALATAKRNPQGIRHTFYIVDRESKLVGVVDLKELLVADPESTVHTVMQNVPKLAFIDMSVNQLLLTWDNSTLELPVVDSENVFVGIISKSSLDFDDPKEKKINNAVVAGNALGELYLIGLTSLFGGSTGDQPKN